MELNKIIQGDCLEVMRDVPDNYIDSIVTDPPYELGFMGKSWDKTGVAYNIDLWKECLRVLKPGGHLLAFGGSRTYHRMACAIEDAGFEIRDQVMWIYGCLSEDTEILTDKGWERYHKTIENNHVLCYNIDKETFEFHKPKRSFIYENKHTAYRIQSNNTDQIVSRNHRCIVERGGRKVFTVAEALEQQENIPFLESLYDLPETLPYIHEGASITKQDLLERVRKQEHRAEQFRSEATRDMPRKAVSNMRGLRSQSLETNGMAKKSEDTDLQPAMQRSTQGPRMEESCQQRQGRLDRREYPISEAKDVWREKPGMERRSNILQNTRELCGSEICSMPRGFSTDGPQRWLHNGASADSGSDTRKISPEEGSCSPYRPQPSEQRPNQSDAIYKQSASQEIRGNGATRTTLATITPIEYNGKVWCVQVPTGAFVARRNGHIFITGNSGFPKSLDISKSIDKMAGAERKVIGRWNGTYADNPQSGGEQKTNGIWRSEKDNSHLDITAPATPEAEQWSGWGTALKPAHEPIVVARKPIGEKNVAKNVLKWGAGGINIDECRVPTNWERDPNKRGWQGRKLSHDDSNVSFVDHNKELSQPNKLGRFPANIILDEEAGKMLDEQSGRVKCGTIKPEHNFASNPGNGITHGSMGRITGYGGYLDTGGASRFFYCPKASKAERGELNTHPTVKPIKLIEYLVKLVTPPDGTTLDIFGGSGTTGVAAINCGRSFILVEKEAEYVEIANRRINEAMR